MINVAVYFFLSLELVQGLFLSFVLHQSLQQVASVFSAVVDCYCPASVVSWDDVSYLLNALIIKRSHRLKVAACRNFHANIQRHDDLIQ
jgi:hypothetical protein